MIGEDMQVQGHQQAAKLIMAANRPADTRLPRPRIHRIRPLISRWSCSSRSLVGIGSVCNRLADLGADRLRVSVVAIAGDPIRNRPVFLAPSQAERTPDADQATRQGREVLAPPAAATCGVAPLCPRRHCSVRLENALGDVQADRSNFHGGRLLSARCIQRPRAWHADAEQEPSTLSFEQCRYRCEGKRCLT